jgi:hypothetical protein
VAADGMVFTFDDAGICTVVRAGDQARILGTNDLKAEIMGTPAIAGKALFIPTSSGLFCIAARKS